MTDLTKSIGSVRETAAVLAEYQISERFYRDYRAFFNKLSLTALDSLESVGRQHDFPLTWALVKAGIRCRYPDDCARSLEYALVHRLSGTACERYSESCGYHIRRGETKRQAVLRALEKITERAREVYANSSVRILSLEDPWKEAESDTFRHVKENLTRFAEESQTQLNQVTGY